MADSLETYPSQGSCFGFDVRSSHQLRTLRQGDTGALLGLAFVPTMRTDGELLLNWHPRRDNPFHGRLLVDGERFLFWASDAGWYDIRPADGTITLARGADPWLQEVRLWGVPAGLCMMARGDLSIHAAAVEINGQAILLAAPGHHGKTTLAAAFLRAGHRLLSEDTSCCRLSPTPLVFPGPAFLRLRRDVVDQLRLSTATVISEMPDRVHVLIDRAVRGAGDPVPLRAIILLKEHAAPPELRRLAPTRVVPDLWALTFKLPNDGSRATTFGALADLAGQVEAYELFRPMTFSSLPSVVQLIESMTARPQATLRD